MYQLQHYINIILPPTTESKNQRSTYQGYKSKVNNDTNKDNLKNKGPLVYAIAGSWLYQEVTLGLNIQHLPNNRNPLSQLGNQLSA
jgi:hypothetical protein